MKLPLTDPLKDLAVVVPVFGEAEVFRRHAQEHQDLWNVAAQVIWVATPSADGAHKLAQELAAAGSGQYLECPPGLYAAWNLGVSQARRPWIYFNTVGDICDPQALREALILAEGAGADLLFSPPKLHPSNLKHLRGWPIFREARSLHRRASRPLLSSWLADFQIRHHDSCVLGSLAGALFRTTFLQSRPFPENFRSAGDTAWMYANVAHLKAVYFPKPVAGFRVHDSQRGYPNPGDLGRLQRLLELAVCPHDRLVARQRRRYLACRRMLDTGRGRRPRRFWFLSPRLTRLWFHRRATMRQWNKLVLEHFPKVPA